MTLRRLLNVAYALLSENRDGKAMRELESAITRGAAAVDAFAWPRGRERAVEPVRPEALAALGAAFAMAGDE